jgi:signal transduction histidine kinase
MLYIFLLSNYGLTAIICILIITVTASLFVFFRTLNQQRQLQEIIGRKLNEKERETSRRIASEFLHQKIINKRIRPQIYQLEVIEELIYQSESEELILEKIQVLKHYEQETRAIIGDISQAIFPPFLSYLFVESCQKRLSELEIQYPNKTKITFEKEGDFNNIDINVLYNFYNIFDLFVTNSLQHSAATEIKISLKQKADEIDFEMQDNGKGFNISEVTKLAKGIGVADLQSRASILSPQFVFQSTSREGTRFKISVTL